MKRANKTRLHVEREVLRVLQDHELRRVEGGGAIPLTFDSCPPPPITGDSKVECCA